MIKYAGYCALLLLLLLLLFLFSVIIIVEIKSSKKFFDKEKGKFKIFNELLTIANKVNKMEISADEYPLMTKYLSQARYIIVHHPYSFDSLSISLLNKGETKQKQAFCSEFLKAPSSVRQKVNELSTILGKIYELQHPVRYKWINTTLEFKKRWLCKFWWCLTKYAIF